MKLSDLLTNVIKEMKHNAPELFTAAAIGGVITTAYLTVKATWEATRMISWEEERGGVAENPRERFKERAKEAWPLYVPPAIAGVATIGAILGASRSNGRRTAAAVAAYSLTERAFSEYREKVVEQIGANKDQKLRDAIAQDRVLANPVSGQVIIFGGGQQLFCELHTHRYFMSDMETLRKAQNDINHWIVTQRYVVLDAFYQAIGLPHTEASSKLGWDDDELMDLQFSAVLTEDGRACVAFSYNYLGPIT